MLKAGIIGCGGISQAHVKGYKKTGKADLVAFYDVDEKRAKDYAEKYGGIAYPTAEDMLNDNNLDAVSICTPPYCRSIVERRQSIGRSTTARRKRAIR